MVFDMDISNNEFGFQPNDITIWVQHHLNNDISNVSYVQMMFFFHHLSGDPEWPCSVVDAFWGPENERSGGTTLSSMDQTWTAFLGPRL